MSAIPKETLYERVAFGYVFACRKHGLADDPEEYAREQVNQLSNSEFLQALSDALEEMKEEGKL